MSMCVDLVELLLLLEYNTTDLLSQYNLSGLSMPFTIFSPVTKFLSHIPWLDASEHATNSAVMVDEAVRVCLTMRQETAPPANIKM